MTEALLVASRGEHRPTICKPVIFWCNAMYSQTAPIQEDLDLSPPCLAKMEYMLAIITALNDELGRVKWHPIRTRLHAVATPLTDGNVSCRAV